MSNRVKESVEFFFYFTSITAEIKLRDSHYMSQTLRGMFRVESQCQE